MAKIDTSFLTKTAKTTTHWGRMYIHSRELLKILFFEPDRIKTSFSVKVEGDFVLRV